MRLRSLLFVPADSARKFSKASAGNADALILDLEDSVAPEQKDKARGFVADLIDAQKNKSRNWKFFVRINDLASGLAVKDLASVVRPGLDGLLIPKANGAQDIEKISNYLDALEARAGMQAGSVKITVVATETATAMFNLI